MVHTIPSGFPAYQQNTSLLALAKTVFLTATPNWCITGIVPPYFVNTHLVLWICFLPLRHL